MVGVAFTGPVRSSSLLPSAANTMTLILNSFTSLGRPGQLSSIEAPKAEYMLPSDDHSWDEGVTATIGHISLLQLIG